MLLPAAATGSSWSLTHCLGRPESERRRGEESAYTHAPTRRRIRTLPPVLQVLSGHSQKPSARGGNWLLSGTRSVSRWTSHDNLLRCHLFSVVLYAVDKRPSSAIAFVSLFGVLHFFGLRFVRRNGSRWNISLSPLRSRAAPMKICARKQRMTFLIPGKIEKALHRFFGMGYQDFNCHARVHYIVGR